MMIAYDEPWEPRYRSPVIGQTSTTIGAEYDRWVTGSKGPDLSPYMPEGATEAEWMGYICRIAGELIIGYGLSPTTSVVIAVASALPAGYSVRQVRDAYTALTGRDMSLPTAYGHLAAAAREEFYPINGMNGVMKCFVDEDLRARYLEEERSRTAAPSEEGSRWPRRTMMSAA